MQLKRISLLAGLIVAAQSQAAITLSNLAAAQREGSRVVDIQFDVANSAGSEAAVYIVVSNASVQVARIDLGNLSEGSGLQAVWDGEADLNGILTSNLSITVQASDPIPAGMVRIPAGTNAGQDPDFGSYSLNVGSFLIDSTEVTKAQWDSIAIATSGIASSDGNGKAPNHPVYNVSWQEAARWCNGRSSQEGLSPCYNPVTLAYDPSASGYRLPFEEEWEYAARGGFSGLRYPWGEEIDYSNANYYSSYYDAPHPDYAYGGHPYTSPVGDFEPNGYGLYDMAGNVWEWCNDPSGVNDRARKGGSWESWEVDLRCGARTVKPSTFESILLGFRTVRNAPEAVELTSTIAFDSRDYTLTVSSDHGSPVPGEGTWVFDWRETVACSVEAAVNEGGTNYGCIGWTGTGGVPLAGASNHVQVVLDELASSIVWNWATDDTDNDGMDDDWETAFFGNLGQAATNDFDRDGQDNGSEYIAGTNPTNPASLFELVPGVAGVDSIKVEWPHAQGRTYNVYWTDNLQYTAFEPLETNIAYPRNSITVTPVQVQGFFKVDVRNQ
jgi:sulfatase modifying factor 1